MTAPSACACRSASPAVRASSGQVPVPPTACDISFKPPAASTLPRASLTSSSHLTRQRAFVCAPVPLLHSQMKKRRSCDTRCRHLRHPCVAALPHAHRVGDRASAQFRFARLDQGRSVVGEARSEARVVVGEFFIGDADTAGEHRSGFRPVVAGEEFQRFFRRVLPFKVRFRPAGRGELLETSSFQAPRYARRTCSLSCSSAARPCNATFPVSNT